MTPFCDFQGQGWPRCGRILCGGSRELDPAIGEITQLKQISAEIRARMAEFVDSAGGDDSTAFFASDLTREHLREVVKLFVSVEPGNYLLPFQRRARISQPLSVCVAHFHSGTEEEADCDFRNGGTGDCLASPHAEASHPFCSVRDGPGDRYIAFTVRHRAI